MAQIVDRRLNGKNKSAVNRQRFIHRFKQQIKQAVSNAISRRSITDIEKGEKIVIPAKDLQEPVIRTGTGGQHEYVHPGNQDFVSGDRIKRPLAGKGGQGNQAGNSDETGIDDFAFTLSREEFLDLFFDDLALPNLVKTQLLQIPQFKSVRAGFTKSGQPNDINIVRSLRGAIGRRIALTANYKREIEEITHKIESLEHTVSSDNPELIDLRKKLILLQEKMHKIPFIDTFDLRFNNRILQPKPTTQAVMFCIMDVSGSMEEFKKELAKRFFILLYLFLTRNYEKIELVFIRHHTSAKEVNEEEFFYSRETGGTVVSSALDLAYDVIVKRYPTAMWNIYIAQASDGDNWNADSPHCADILMQQIMPCVQYYAYVEIMPQMHQNLWESYVTVQQNYPNFAMKSIDAIEDIYPVFRELFKSNVL